MKGLSKLSQNQASPRKKACIKRVNYPDVKVEAKGRVTNKENVMDDEHNVQAKKKRPLPNATKNTGTLSKRARGAALTTAVGKQSKSTPPLRQKTLSFKPMSSPASSAASDGSNKSTKTETCLGLVRISAVSSPPESPPAQDTIIPLFQGAILGRTNDNPNSSVPEKVNLGIDSKSAPGVSRSQLRVLHATDKGLTVNQLPTVIQPMGLSKYSAKTNTMGEPRHFSPNEKLFLLPNDILIFDSYRNKEAQHFFRVVSFQKKVTGHAANRPLATSKTATASSDAATRRSAATKRKLNTSSPSEDETNHKTKQQSPQSEATAKRLPSPATQSKKDSAPATVAGPNRAKGKKLLDTFDSMVKKQCAATENHVASANTEEPEKAVAASIAATANQDVACKTTETPKQAVAAPMKAKSIHVAAVRIEEPKQPVADQSTASANHVVPMKIEEPEQSVPAQIAATVPIKSEEPEQVVVARRTAKASRGPCVKKEQPEQAVAVPVAAKAVRRVAFVKTEKPEQNVDVTTDHVAPVKSPRPDRSAAAAPVAVSVVQTPCAGDRVRVWYHRSEDTFGKRRGARGWYFATVTKILKNRIEVCFDDFSAKTIKYPAKDVQLLSSEHSVFYAEYGTPNQKFAYDANPTDLRLGDLVFGLYQNGASHGARFRGRVAFVDQDHHKVDIAYDDGEYERQVPVTEGIIFLVERSEDDPSWMEEIKFVATIHRKRKDATITQAGPEGVSVKFMEDNSVRVFPHSEIVALLMAYAKEKAKENRKILIWPAPNDTAKSKNATNPDDDDDEQSLEDDGMKKARDLRSSSHPKRSEIDNGTNKDGVIGTEKLSSLPILALENDLSVELVPLMLAPGQCTGTDDKCIISTEVPQEMDPSLGKAFWNAINSKEAFFGAQLLNFATTAFKEAPCVEAFRNLIALVSFGPKYNKTSPYPDGAKMGLAFEYLKKLLLHPEYATRLVDSAVPKYWMDCLCQATRATHCQAGDESRVTVAALRRVGNSLQVSAYCEELFADMLEFQLKECQSDHEALRQKSYRSKSIIRPMLDNCGGTRQLLKMFTRALTHMLLWYGHHVLGNMTSVEPDTLAIREAKDLCHTQAVRLVAALGRICVNMAWLHSAENDSDEILAQDCALLMQEAFDAEFLEKDFDPSPFLDLPKGKGAAEKLKAKHWERVKFHLVVCLEGPLATELRQCLARRLDIQSVYDLCYGNK